MANTGSYIIAIFNVQRLIGTGGRATDLWYVTGYTRTVFTHMMNIFDSASYCCCLFLTQ
jgi:hypothetical protein